MCCDLWVSTSFWAGTNHWIKRAVLLVLCGITTSGCGKDRKQEQEEKKAANEASQYADLSRTLATKNDDLRDELARIADERGTPLQLYDAGRARLPNSGNPQAAVSRKPLAQFLPTLVSRYLRKRIESGAGEFMPEEEFIFRRIDLENALEFCHTYDDKRMQIRSALSKSPGGFGFDHRLGLIADLELEFVHTMRVYVWLEALTVAELIDDEKFSEAVKTLSYMLNAISLLSQEKHMVPRLTAAQLRRDAIMVLERIARHPLSTRAIRESLYSLTLAQLAAWPSDADAWIGDRSMGLHTFEMIRDGHLLSILSRKEIDEFQEDGTLASLAKTLSATIEDDELFYLESMRAIIESCDKPFFERKETFTKIQDLIEQADLQEVYPMISDRILLRDIEEGQRLQARDRALVEGWAIALALATGQKGPSSKVNPLTGVAYKIKTDETRVIVSGIGGTRTDRPIELSLIAAPLKQ